MSEPERSSGPEGTHVPTDDRRSRPVSRRSVLATGAVLSTSALVGCLGGSTSGSGGNATETEPEQPWTTEALADYVEDGATLNVYAGSGDPDQWQTLFEVVNDEFDVSLDSDVFVSDGGTISQRVIQERQAGEDVADIVVSATDIRDRIHAEGRDVAREYYEWDIGSKFWFGEELEDYMTLPWGVSAINGGASSVMPLNEELFEERGLDYPTTYNDLLDDQYEGMTVLLPDYVVGSQIGWIIGQHAAQTDMSEMEWMQAMLDHLEFQGASSHSAGGRTVAEGNAPLMFYNFPWTISKLVAEYPLRGHFVDGVKWNTFEGLFSINNEAPNPWAARFFASAVLEESVQRRILSDVGQLTPSRLELEYDTSSLDPYTRSRLEAELTPVTFSESADYTEVGNRAKEEVIDY